MADLASLGFDINTSQIDAASKSLSNFSQSGKSAQVSTDVLVASAIRLGISVQEVERRLAAANDNLSSSAEQAMKFADATKQAAAANDNFAKSITSTGEATAKAGRGFLETIENALSLVGHLKLLALAAYALSPAFRSVVNTGISKVLLEIIPAAGLAGKAISGIASALAPAASFFASIGTPILAAVGAFTIISSVWSKGAALIDKYANSLRSLYSEDIVQNLAKLTRGQGEAGDIISAEQIARATELGVRLQDAGFIISKFLTTSIIDFTNISLKLQSVWVAIVETLAKAVQYISLIPWERVGKVAANVISPTISAAVSAGSSLLPESPKEDQSSSIQAATARLSAMMGVANLASESLNKANRSVGDLSEELDIGGSFIARYSDAIKKLTDGVKETDTWDRVARAIARMTAMMATNTESVGQTIEAQERLRAETRLLESTKGGLNAATDEQIAKYVELRAKIDETGNSMSVEQALQQAGIRLDKDRIETLTELSKAAGAARQQLAQENFAIANQKAIEADKIAIQGLNAYSAAQKGAVAEAQKRLELEDLRRKGVATDVQVEERAASARKLAIATELKQLSEAARARALAADQSVKSAEVAISAAGKSVGENYRLLTIEQTRQQLEQDASARRSKINQAELEALTEKINKTAQLKQLEAEKGAQDKATFELQTVMLSDLEKQIATTQKQLHGDNWKDFMSDGLSNTIRLTAGLKELKDTGQQFTSTFVQGLMSGKSVMDSLSAAAKQLSSALAEGAIKSLFSGDFVGAAIKGIGAVAAAVIGNETEQDKSLEEAKKRFKEMESQVISFNRAADGFDLGPLTSELENLRQVHDTLAMAALEARDYASLNQIHETLNRGIRRVFGEWMNGIPVLGDLSQKIQDLKNEAQGLKGVIPEAAAAIDQGLIARIRQVTEEAERSLQTDINSAMGLDWLNDAGVAIARFNDLAGKVDPTLLNTWFVVNAQKIIDGSQLTGEAFQQLVDKLSQTVPGIADSLHEFTEAIKRTAADIARAKQSFSDQLFTLQQDQNTLQGALAVFELQARRQREEEIKAGGQALVELEALQAQQRYDIIKSFAEKAAQEQQAAAEAQIRAMQQAQDAFNSFVRNIQDFISHYLSGTESGLSPAARLANAQAAFNSQLSLAQGGDRNALNSITQYFTDLVNASKGFYGSTAAGQSINSTALSQLQALPGQISPEQFIVNAIVDASTDNINSLSLIEDAILNSLITAVATGDATTIANALVPHFKYLTGETGTYGLLRQGQLEDKLNLPDGSLDKIFKELDGNGDGILEYSEAIKVATEGTKVGTDHLPDVETNTDSLPTQATKISGMETSLLALAQVSNNTGITSSLLNEKLNQNLREISHTLDPNVTLYGSGGYTGNGAANRIAGLVHGQEFVLNRFATSAIGTDVLHAINRSGVLPTTATFNRISAPSNDNIASDAVVAVIEKLIAKIGRLEERLVAAERGAAEYLGDKLDSINENTGTTAKADRRAA